MKTAEKVIEEQASEDSDADELQESEAKSQLTKQGPKAAAPSQPKSAIPKP